MFNLPTELVNIILDCSELDQVKVLRQTCQRMHDIVTPRLWQHLVIICGLHARDQYEDLAHVPKKIFNRPRTLVVDVDNVAEFANQVGRMPAMMRQFETLTLVNFQSPMRMPSVFNNKPQFADEKRALSFLASSLHELVNVKVVKMHCEPIESAILQRFASNFGPSRVQWKYVLLPFREYLDDVPTASSMSVYWSAETAPLPLHASFVSDKLTKVIFRQDDGVSTAPYDVAKVKETFAGCANLVKLVLQVHLVDQYATTNWIPESVKDLRLLGKYESQTPFSAGHVEKVRICETTKDAAMNITYNDFAFVDVV